jgi:hypothetical protein
MEIRRVSEAKSPDEMDPWEIHDEIDRLHPIAERRCREGKTYTFLQMRVCALLDELQRRGLLPIEP